MPIVEDKITGEVISRQRYNDKGIQNASIIAKSNPNWEVKYDSANAMDRKKITYPGNGKTGYNIPKI